MGEWSWPQKIAVFGAISACVVLVASIPVIGSFVDDPRGAQVSVAITAGVVGCCLASLSFLCWRQRQAEIRNQTKLRTLARVSGLIGDLDIAGGAPLAADSTDDGPNYGPRTDDPADGRTA